MKTNILLRFTSQRLGSSRFNCEQFTRPSFLSLRFQVAFSSLRFCCRRLTSLSFASPGFSSPFQAKNIVFRLRHFAPSFLLPSQPHSQGLSFLPSGNQRRETLGTMVPPSVSHFFHRDLKVFFKTNFVYSSGIWKIFSQSLMQSQLFSVWN